MNRLFALVIVMSMNVDAATPTPTPSPTPEKSPSYNDIYSEKFRQVCDTIDLDREDYDSLTQKIHKNLVRFGYIYEETESADAQILITSVRQHLTDKWWYMHSRIRRAAK